MAGRSSGKDRGPVQDRYRAQGFCEGAVLQENAGSVQHRLTAADAGGTDQVLQALVWPDPKVHPDPRLCFRLGAGVSVQTCAPAVVFEAGSVLRLDTAYNIFSWVKWRGACDIAALGVRIRGVGTFVVEVVADQPEARDVLTANLILADGQPQVIDLTRWLIGRPDSVLHLSLRAVNQGRIDAVSWCTPQTPKRRPKLLLCVTTFRREAAATATAIRIDANLQGHPLADDMHLLVVDNGRSLTLPPLAHVTLVGNRNLGGAGGFARGLAEAVAQGYSHCLFMDDDASVDFASIERTWRFLANLTDPATAIAGMLMRGDAPTIVWENGAVFHGIYRPFFRDMDLTDLDDLTTAEFAGLRAPPANFYGAFWYFAFPLASVRHWPFPFFVRGDDVNFSIVNRFRITTLPGVISFQELDFNDKDTPLVQYLNLRADLLQVLLLPIMAGRFWRALLVPCVHFLRMLVMCRVDSLRCLNIAVADVFRGPQFFAAHADLTERRAEMAALRQHEVWRPVAGPLPGERRRINPKVAWQRMVLKLSLNGLFLPFFGWWGNQITLPRNDRKLVSNCWGASQITYLSPDGTQAMTLRQDKGVIWREGLAMVWNLARLALRYRRLRKTWLAAFPYLTSPAFWQAQFDKEA